MKKVIKDRNSLLFWFPKIQHLPIPQPKTEIVLFAEKGYDYIEYLGGRIYTPKLLDELRQKAKLIGYPLFMRTDYLSGKHEWLCYVENETSLCLNIPHFIELTANAGLFGLPLHAFALREFLELDSTFRAFGGLPIARERRYFIENGKVKCHHPYWVKEALQFWGNVIAPLNWQRQLRKLNIETKEEIELLTDYSLQVASILEGYWSVDFAYSKQGVWYLIDMASGEESWHPPCHNKLTNYIQGA